MNLRILACYSPAIVVALGAVLAATSGPWSRAVFLLVFAASIVVHIRWGRA